MNASSVRIPGARNLKLHARLWGEEFATANSGPDEAFATANSGPDEAIATANSGPGEAFATANSGPGEAFATANSGPGEAFATANSGPGEEIAGEKTPLVFIHGFGNDSHVWDASAPLVAPHYRTIAIDLPGHGDSDNDPEQLYDPLSLSLSLDCALDALKIERLVVVGHSLGGRVAMHFAVRHPERMAGLVLVDSAPEHDPRGSARIRSETESAELVFGSIREYEVLLADLYPATKPATLAELARHWLREREDGKFEPKLDPIFRRAERANRSAKELEAQADEQRALLWDGLPKVECPTLLIRGSASDVLSPDISDRLVEEVLPNGHFVEVPRASHSVMLDNPEGFNQVLTDFVLG